MRILSVSNSLSGRHWELDQVPAVGDPTDIVQLGSGAMQRSSILDSARKLGIRDAQELTEDYRRMIYAETVTAVEQARARFTALLHEYPVGVGSRVVGRLWP